MWDVARAWTLEWRQFSVLLRVYINITIQVCVYRVQKYVLFCRLYFTLLKYVYVVCMCLSFLAPLVKTTC